MQKITPHLWFDKEAQEAAEFYVSVFGGDSRIGKTATLHNTPSGDTLVVPFTLLGCEFLSINGGPIFKFNEAISLIVNCVDQAEVDYYWEKLSAVPEAEQCGWLKDKYGLSWQIVPTRMGEMMQNGTPEQIDRVTQAFLPMKKLIIADLEKAYQTK